MRFGDCEADGVTDALTERAGRHLNAGRVTGFRMSRRFRMPLAERFEVVKTQIVTGEIQQAVQQRRTMSGGEDETIPVEPMWVLRIVAQMSRPNRVRERCNAERQSRMSRVRLLHGVD